MAKILGRSILGVICLIAVVLTGCQKKERLEQLDKDEEHGLVIARELSNSRVQAIEEDVTGQLWTAMTDMPITNISVRKTRWACPTIMCRRYSVTNADDCGWQR